MGYGQNRNLSFSLFALFALLASCQKEVETPKDQQILVISRTSGQPLPSIEVALNGQFQGYTDEQGYVSLPYIFGYLNSRRACFEYTLVTQFETETQLNTTYWATKKASEKDSLAVALLMDLQNVFGLLPTVPYGTLVSTYDQALAAIALTLSGETQSAERIFDFFDSKRTSELENGPGGFYQFRSVDGTPTGRRWMGDNAWLLIALKNYEEATGTDKYSTLIASLENWLIGLNDPIDNGPLGRF